MIKFDFCIILKVYVYIYTIIHSYTLLSFILLLYIATTMSDSSTTSYTTDYSTSTVNDTSTNSTGNGNTDNEDDDTVEYVLSAVAIIFCSTLLFVCILLLCLQCLFGPPTLRKRVYKLLIRIMPKSQFIRDLEDNFEAWRRGVEEEVATGFGTVDVSTQDQVVPPHPI